MSDIQSLIKQTKFESSFQKAQVNLIYTYNDYQLKTKNIFKQYGILPQHFNVLKIVKGKHPEPVSPGYIREVILDKGRDLTRLVDKLVELDLLERHICPHNKRMKNLNITAKGIDLVKRLEKELVRWAERHNKMTEEEADLLSRLLDKFRGSER